MTFDVRRIANATLSVADARGFEVTNMALNKLTYFAHGWHLALVAEPLVETPFEAWQHGPVHPKLYREFKGYGAAPITGRATRIDFATGNSVPVEESLPEIVRVHLEEIVDFYGRLSASRLSQISHETGAPWDQIWSRPGSTPGMTIPDAVTREYYQSKMRRTH